MKLKYNILLVALVFGVVACDKDYTPKQKGYNRIETPTHEYINLPDSFPYTFEYSNHATLMSDTSWLTERYWFDLVYKDLGASITVSYKPVHGSQQLLEEYLGTSLKLTSKHQVKAYSIEEHIIKTEKGLTAVLAELTGEIPSQVQFFCTDSTKHFVRGALYFNTATENDSLAPVIKYVSEDIVHMLNTLEWKD